MKWKLRRRDVPERLEPSLSDAALAEEEGLDRFLYHTWEYLENLPVFQLYVSRCTIQSVSDLQYFIIPNTFVRKIRKLFVILLLLS